MKFSQILLDGSPRALLETEGETYLLAYGLDQHLQEGDCQALIEGRIQAEDLGQKYQPGPETKHLAPLSRVNRVFCLGLNFTDHAQEVGAQLPTYPTIFSKFSSALIGPEDPIYLPAESRAVDWEVELCLVIGRRGRRISLEEADQHILGYSIMNDISMRDWQGRTSEWFQGKNWDQSTPWGPRIVTANQLKLEQGLTMTCSVDGRVRQQGNSRNMIFSPQQVVAYLSTLLTLEAGDLISLGTPAGVGLSLRPRQWLAAGQQVLTSIEGIGSLTNTCQLEEA